MTAKMPDPNEIHLTDIPGRSYRHGRYKVHNGIGPARSAVTHAQNYRRRQAPELPTRIFRLADNGDLEWELVEETGDWAGMPEQLVIPGLGERGYCARQEESDGQSTLDDTTQARREQRV